MKKGQAQVIFTWIFVLVLAISILFLGVKLIRQSNDLKDEVVLVDFFKNLEKKINNYYYLDVGSSGTEEFILPEGATKVCFIDNDFNDINEFEGAFMLSLKEYSNIFVFPKDKFKENRYHSTHFIVEDDAQCFTPSGSKVKIKFENTGKNVEIKR